MKRKQISIESEVKKGIIFISFDGDLMGLAETVVLAHDSKGFTDTQSE